MLKNKGKWNFKSGGSKYPLNISISTLTFKQGIWTSIRSDF